MTVTRPSSPTGAAARSRFVDERAKMRAPSSRTFASQRHQIARTLIENRRLGARQAFLRAPKGGN